MEMVRAPVGCRVRSTGQKLGWLGIRSLKMFLRSWSSDMRKGVAWGFQGPLSTLYTASAMLGLAGAWEKQLLNSQEFWEPVVKPLMLEGTHGGSIYTERAIATKRDCFFPESIFCTLLVLDLCNRAGHCDRGWLLLCAGLWLGEHGQWEEPGPCHFQWLLASLYSPVWQIYEQVIWQRRTVDCRLTPHISQRRI